MTTTLEAIRARVVRARQTAEVPPLCISDRAFLLGIVDEQTNTIDRLRDGLRNLQSDLEEVISGWRQFIQEIEAIEERGRT
jgi:hypothetical protein